MTKSDAEQVLTKVREISFSGYTELVVPDNDHGWSVVVYPDSDRLQDNHRLLTIEQANDFLGSHTQREEVAP